VLHQFKDRTATLLHFTLEFYVNVYSLKPAEHNYDKDRNI